MRCCATTLLAGAVWTSLIAPQLVRANEGFKFNASQAVQSDGNLFRLPASANVLAATGKQSGAELISATSLGMGYNKFYGLQRVELDVTLVSYDYRSFGNLSFLSKNYGAAWHWSLTPSLVGKLSAEQKETQNSFADTVGSTQPNVRVDTSREFDVSYDFQGGLKAIGGISLIGRTNQALLLGQSDYAAESRNLGLQYVAGSGSSVALNLRQTDGKYSNQAPLAATLVDSGYSQIDYEVKGNWIINGKSSADMTLVSLSRRHPTFPQRDFEGVNAKTNLLWSPTAKTSVNLGWSRDLASYQTVASNFTQTDRVSLVYVWQITPRTSARIGLETASIDYLAPPARLPVVNRKDTKRDTIVSVFWNPTNNMTFSASVQASSRESSLAGFDYSSDIFAFAAQFNY